MKYEVDEKVIPSIHAEKRIKERIGIPKKSRDRYINIIMEKGKDSKDFKDNKKIYKYLSAHENNTYKIKVYGEHMMILTRKNNVVVTVFKLPKRIFKLFKKE